MTDAGFTVYPAIDVRGGRVVRLAQGDYDRQTDYGGDPLAIADAYARAGAEWLHLVDLDAAKSGGYTLAPLLQAIVVATGLRVQTGGGVRSRDDVVAILEAGAARVVVGSLAVRDPTLVQGWVEEFGPESITVALDARQAEDGEWRLPTHGWTEASGARLDGLAEAYASTGLVHLLSTDIDKDGMLSGPNLGLYRYLRQIAPSLQVQASGGVRGLDDVVAAKAVGCAGVVLGRALLEGRLDLAEALAC